MAILSVKQLGACSSFQLRDGAWSWQSPPSSPSSSSGPLYGSLLKAWQCFLSSADRLSSLHAAICRSLVSEDGDRVRSWQKDSFHKKMFGGFKESQDVETGFVRAQKPWAKKLKKVSWLSVPFSQSQEVFFFCFLFYCFLFVLFLFLFSFSFFVLQTCHCLWRESRQKFWFH